MHALVDALTEHYWPLAAVRSTYGGATVSEVDAAGQNRRKRAEKRELPGD